MYLEKNHATAERFLHLVKADKLMMERANHLMEWIDTAERKKYFNSMICFQPNDSYFRFIANKTFNKIPHIFWDNYESISKKCYIKDRLGSFWFLNTEPFTVIVSNSDWVFNNTENNKALFYGYITRAMLKEENLWQINSNAENRLLQVNKARPGSTALF